MIDRLIVFTAECELVGVEPPAVIERAHHILAVAREHARTRPEATVFDLSDDEIRARVTDGSIRLHEGPSGMTYGLQPGLDEVEAEVQRELLAVVEPELERIIVELQPRFDELAAPVVAAVRRFNFTARTQSDQIVAAGDHKAFDAWRALPDQLAPLHPIASLRESMSKIFGVSPTDKELTDYFLNRNGDATHPDYSVCFAAGDNWSTTGGFYLEGKARGSLDWLALAAGGLHLNTPGEVGRRSSPPASSSCSPHRSPAS